MFRIKYHILLIVLFISCKYKKTESLSAQNNSQHQAIEQSFAWTKADTVFIDYFLENESIAIPGEILRKAIAKYPDLLSEAPVSKEEVFSKKHDAASEPYDGELDSYSSLIYTYLLRLKYKKPEHQFYRIKLLQLFTNVNGLYKALAHGGTGFMHMYEELPALVEFEMAKRYFNNSYEEEPTADFKEEKKYYVGMIRAMVAARKAIDFELEEEEKKKVYKDIDDMINALDKGITDAYLMNTVRRFQYSNYE